MIFLSNMLWFLSHFLLCIFCQYFLCGEYGSYIKHLVVITINFKLKTTLIAYKNATLLLPPHTLHDIDVTNYFFLYWVYINIFYIVNFILLLFSISELKIAHAVYNMLQYYSILFLSMYLISRVRFMLSYTFMLLSSILLFQVEKFSLSISCKAGLVVINSVSFCLPAEVFIPSFFKNSFVRYSIIAWQFFSFQLFEYINPLLGGL